ncbi:EAL domain-containing protein [Curvivirga sp.]|uniref:EAL domain-containing protein n=1 Tax=Curvivirga sp. TaxID=2856848 RepID=UPI003B5C62C7
MLIFTLWSSFSQTVQERKSNASLYAGIIENSYARAIESVEASLLAVSEEMHLYEIGLIGEQELMASTRRILGFAPHIRQVVIFKDDRLVFDSAKNRSREIDRSQIKLGQPIDTNDALKIGEQIFSRFLPVIGDPPVDNKRRSLIPLSLTLPIFNDDADSKYELIAALNTSYFIDIIEDLKLLPEDKVGVYGFIPNQKTKFILGTSDLNNDALNGSLINQLLKDGAEQSSTNLYSGIFEQETIVIQLLEKFPLAVVVTLCHDGTFWSWLGRNLPLILGLSAISTLIAFSVYRVRREYEKSTRLKEQIKLLSAALHQSPVSVLITDAERSIRYINPAFTSVFGYDFDEVENKNPRLLRSNETEASVYQEMWGNLNKGDSWLGEFINKTKDGRRVYVTASISPVLNETGELTHYIGVLFDTTSSKENEKQLRLAATVFNSATEAVMVTDAENRILTVNNAFTDITGHEQNDVIGLSPSILNSGHQDQTFYEDMYANLNDKGFWGGEIWNRRKSGEVYPEWLTITSLYDSDGNLEGYVSLFSDITKRKQDEEHIIRQANFDSLTGLANRNLFADRFTRAIDRAEREDHQVALLFIDLDRFKNVNDTLGHAVGDLLLQRVTKRLLGELRKTDTAARLGGDEFAAILPNIVNMYNLERIVKRILKSLSTPYNIDGHEIFISASIGITLYPDDAKITTELLRNADSAMYMAKDKGRNAFHYYTRELSEQAEKRHQLESALHHGLENDEFHVYYQPITDMSNSRTACAEALVRWNHPELGFISPDDFIPLAEEIGLIVPMGELILRKACLQAVKWIEEIGSNAPGVAVNMSSFQFQRQHIPTLVKEILINTGLPATKLTLEITERLLIVDTDEILQQLQEIRELGVGLSIDDFGTGYSSLSYLKKFPITKLKIDKAFIQDMETDEENMALVDSILNMAKSLKLEVVAEGVETQEQEDILRERGCDFVQGYLHSRPLYRKDFMTYLINKN